MASSINEPVMLGDGLNVAPQGYGCMGLADYYGPADDKESLRTLHAAVDAGINLLDTANIYGNGRNEELLGRLLRRRRGEVVLATKFGVLSGADAGGYRSRGDAAYVREQVQQSLARLGVEHIDLYYYHRRDLRIPIEETVQAMAELVTAGLIKHIGLSEVTAEELRLAQAVHPVTAVQSEWSIWSRDVEKSVVPAAAELGVGFVPYAPLGRGFLTQAAQQQGEFSGGDIRRFFPRFAPDTMTANQGIAHTVEHLARSAGVTPAQLCLAWLYAKGRSLGLPVVPIPWTRRSSRVRENLDALAVELDPATLTALDSLSDGVQGLRAADPASVSAGRE